MDSSQNPFLLNGKKILVTGAASGIGRATSIALSSLGADVALADINAEGIESTRELCKGNTVSMKIDLSASETFKEEILKLTSSFGKLNGLVHVAGKPYVAPLKSVTAEKCQEVYNINTYAAIELAKTFINRNVCAGASSSVVFISSVYALVGSAANVGYAMSKAALHGITKALAIELAPKKIRVNCVAPGFVKTNMLDATQQLFDENYFNLLTQLHPLGLGEPEDVAHTIAFLLSDAAKWITGSIISVDGGFTAQ